MIGKKIVNEFIKKDNLKTMEEVIEFLEINNIDFAFFENIEELFNYYYEEDYQSFTSNIVDIIFKNGSMIKILN